MNFVSAKYKALKHNYKEAIMKYNCTNQLSAMEYAVKMPVSSFFISEKRIYNILNDYASGISNDRCYYNVKRRTELIIKRYFELLDSGFNGNLAEAASIISKQPAPELYMTARSALLFYSKHRKMEQKIIRYANQNRK